MKKSFLVKALGLGLLSASSLVAGAAYAGICPSVGGPPMGGAVPETDCGVVFGFGPGGTITTYSGNGTAYGSGSFAGTIDSNPYDGSDDALVGVFNNSGATVNGISLSGSGNGGGIFAFDGDGQGYPGYYPGGVTYTPPSPYTPSGDYSEGPGTAFTNINASGTAGDVVFINGLADGSAIWFSLEGAPSSITVSVPEPASLALLGIGLAGLSAARRRKSAA